MKNEAVNHTKMGRLMRRLGLPRYAAAGIMELLWKTAARERPAGDIGALTDEDIAISVDWGGNPAELVRALIDSGWLDEDDRFRLVIHDHSKHCEDLVHSRLCRLHGYFADGTVPKRTGLRKTESAAIEAFYRANPVAPWLRQDAQPVAHPGATDNPTLPFHALPIQSNPGEAAPPPPQTASGGQLVDFPKPSRKEPEAPRGMARVAVTIPEDFDFEEWFEGLYRSHPMAKRKNIGLAKVASVEALQSGTVSPGEITRVHGLMCHTEAWQWKNGAGAPSLSEWLMDKGWRYPPAPDQQVPQAIPPGRVSRHEETLQRIANSPSNR